jgi:aspartyl-tRNA(Asn)/glutamyl-tRNA(Gln) amidotransferase subunit B
MKELLASGGRIDQQTRSFDATTGTSFALRTKEEANDYRYFADPDLPPFEITEEYLEQISRSLPELPEQKVQRYVTELGLSEYDARVICDDQKGAGYFESLIEHTVHYKAAANWMLGPLRAMANQGTDLDSFPVGPARLAHLISLVEEGKVSFSIASSRILPELVRTPDEEPMQTAVRLNLMQDTDSGELSRWIQEVMNRMPEKVAEYRKGKKGLLGLFVGEVKRLSKGKADPKRTNQLLQERLESE